jgi:hypothetical protein
LCLKYFLGTQLNTTFSHVISSSSSSFTDSIKYFVYAFLETGVVQVTPLAHLTPLSPTGMLPQCCFYCNFPIQYIKVHDYAHSCIPSRQPNDQSFQLYGHCLGVYGGSMWCKSTMHHAQSILYSICSWDVLLLAVLFTQGLAAGKNLICVARL